MKRTLIAVGFLFLILMINGYIRKIFDGKKTANVVYHDNGVKVDDMVKNPVGDIASTFCALPVNDSTYRINAAFVDSIANEINNNKLIIPGKPYLKNCYRLMVKYDMNVAKEMTECIVSKYRHQKDSLVWSVETKFEYDSLYNYYHCLLIEQVRNGCEESVKYINAPKEPISNDRLNKYIASQEATRERMNKRLKRKLCYSF